MGRQKRPHPLLRIARNYLKCWMPDLEDAPLRLRMLDGPPGSPRYSVTVEVCPDGVCPHGTAAELARAGRCPVEVCSLRRSVRLLLDRQGTVIQETQSGVHWGQGTLKE